MKIYIKKCLSKYKNFLKKKNSQGSYMRRNWMVHQSQRVISSHKLLRIKKRVEKFINFAHFKELLLIFATNYLFLIS